MAIEVVLHVFSGRKNPAWILNPAQEVKFQALLKVSQSRPSVDRRAERKPPALGYRGFVVRSPVEGPLAEPIRVYGGIVQQGGERYEDARRELEKWLLETGASSISKDLEARISQELAQH